MKQIILLLAIASCDAHHDTSIDGNAADRFAVDALDRCTESCPGGMLCANGRCKAVCPGPGGIGQTCGPVGSICCGLGEQCLTGGPIACTDSCSPLGGGCPTGFGCHIMDLGASQTYSDCREAGTGLQGASCTTSANCAAGFYCIGGTTPMCVAYCIVDDLAHGCDAGTTCHGIRFFEHALYGFCF